MKKTFALKIEGRHPDRLLEAIKHEIRKYLARERRKPLPKGADFWDFDCRFGLDVASAEVLRVGAITEAINAAVAGGAGQFYIELLAKPGHRVIKTPVVSYDKPE